MKKLTFLFLAVLFISPLSTSAATKPVPEPVLAGPVTRYTGLPDLDFFLRDALYQQELSFDNYSREFNFSELNTSSILQNFRGGAITHCQMVAYNDTIFHGGLDPMCANPTTLIEQYASQLQTFIQGIVAWQVGGADGARLAPCLGESLSAPGSTAAGSWQIYCTGYPTGRYIPPTAPVTPPSQGGTVVDPIVTTMSATRAAPGTTITITGSNFDPASGRMSVQLYGVLSPTGSRATLGLFFAARATSVTSTSLKFVVPTNTKTGDYLVDVYNTVTGGHTFAYADSNHSICANGLYCNFKEVLLTVDPNTITSLPVTIATTSNPFSSGGANATTINFMNALINKLNALSGGAGGVTSGGGSNLFNIGTYGQNQSGQSSNITVTADLLNVREAPILGSVVVKQLRKGESFTATGSVEGENIEGTNRWWKTTDGNYVWSGGTVSN